MTKLLKDLLVKRVDHIANDYTVLYLTDNAPLPKILPGQFVELDVKTSPNTFLRRPISVNFVDYEQNELWLLIRSVGEGTHQLCALQPGDKINTIFPLGHGFSTPSSGHYLLVGGGVGTAPLLYLGKKLKEKGCTPTFLLGGRTAKDLLQRNLFKQYGRVCTTTEDGSDGSKGFVTDHEVINNSFDGIFCCGPKPMMHAVAEVAKQSNTPCEVSLENLMACGVGACLCCVEKTTTGNRCVCQDGPVFNIKELNW